MSIEKKSAASKTGTPSSEPKTIGERIRSLRIHKGMSQKVLGELLAVDKTVVSKWETGRLPKQDMVDALADVFNVTSTYLIYGRNDALSENLLDLNGLTFYQIKLVKELVEEFRKSC